VHREYLKFYEKRGTQQDFPVGANRKPFDGKMMTMTRSKNHSVGCWIEEIKK